MIFVFSRCFAEISKMQRLLLGLALSGVLVSAQNYLDESDTSSTNCPCGWGAKGRIVGGKESRANAYPFMTALTLSDRQPFCGATIITRKHAVTAAHCTYDIKNKINELRLLVGAHDVRRAVNGQFIPVAKTIEHPNYDAEDNEAHDIAIVELDRLLIFRNDVGPACLPNRRVNLENNHLLVAGWGLTKHEGRTSRVLREVILRVIPWETCHRFYHGELQKFRSQFCTYEKRKDSCQGDSGGPLIAIDPIIPGYVLVGLVSFGRECASENPAVNTEVAYYLDWIKGVVKDTTNGAMETCSRIT
ncbi:venom serine protease [Halyomorpha halys]|uniref:venom serine protease n=1 Tax=Halyomorpha halys TaxID=286706 RepID=UPI0006D5187D|nr:venom serine protease isoform X2 [Halyomorpha halys]